MQVTQEFSGQIETFPISRVLIANLQIFVNTSWNLLALAKVTVHFVCLSFPLTSSGYKILIPSQSPVQARQSPPQGLRLCVSALSLSFSHKQSHTSHTDTHNRRQHFFLFLIFIFYLAVHACPIPWFLYIWMLILFSISHKTYSPIVRGKKNNYVMYVFEFCQEHMQLNQNSTDYGVFFLGL